MARYFLPRTALLLLASALVGCTSASVDAPVSQQNLRKIGTAYREFSIKEKRPPAKAKDLAPYLKDAGENVFRSENDGEEFVIHWGVDIVGPPGKDGIPVTAYEKTGKGGVRLVLRGFTIQPMNEEEFQKAPFPPGTKRP